MQSGFNDTRPVPAPKRIIICCDGTWQSSVGTETNIPSNVTRLARYIMKVGVDDQGKQWQQVVFYDAGIGTGVSSTEASRQGATGSGFVGNVIEAYNFIVLNYSPGDKIICIGFSRGAYTARAVAGLVTDIGIIKPRNMQNFAELYRLYQDHDDSHEFRKSAAMRRWCQFNRCYVPESSRWIEAVAVFDTVGSLGIPQVPGYITGFFMKVAGTVIPVEKAGFHNVALSPYIKNAYHALALDEHRSPFGPTLWHYPTERIAAPPRSDTPLEKLRETWGVFGGASGSEKEVAKAWEELADAEMYEELKDHHSNLLQVWFPGVHINVGGGSDDLLKTKISDFEGIAMITFTWMVEQLQQHLKFGDEIIQVAVADRFYVMQGLVEELWKEKKKDHWLLKSIDAKIKQDKYVDNWKDGGKSATLNYANRVLEGWAMGPIIDSFEGTMTLGGSTTRTPGEYKERKLASGKTVKLGDANEQIHPSVMYRMEQLKNYKPDALKGFKRQLKENSDGTKIYEWVKGGLHVPEYKMKPVGFSMERILIWPDTDASQFLQRVDDALGVTYPGPSAEEMQALIEANKADAVSTGFQEQTGFIPSHSDY